MSIEHNSNGPVAGDINGPGDEILVKTYGSLRYWRRSSGVSIRDTLSQPGEYTKYQAERQGESVCFSSNNDGFYTLSEGVNSPLYFYRRTGLIRKQAVYSAGISVRPTLVLATLSVIVAMIASLRWFTLHD